MLITAQSPHPIHKSLDETSACKLYLFRTPGREEVDLYKKPGREPGSMRFDVSVLFSLDSLSSALSFSF